MPARKHHYVPVFYQKGFADSEGLVWVYDRVRKTYQHLPPKVVCRAEDFYAVRPAGAPRDQRIETDILSPIEGMTAPVIRKVGEYASLSMEDCAQLSVFIGLQFTRVPSFARAVSRVLEELIQQRTRIQFANVDRASLALRELERDTGKAVEVDAASMVDYVTRGQFVIKATERPFLENMVRQARSIAQFVAESDRTILVAPSRSGFITSDSALVSVPPQGLDLTRTGGGYGLPGVVNYFPLTRSVCLELRHGQVGYRYRNVDGRYVRIVNRNIAATSDRFIIGSSDRQMRTLVRDCGLDMTEYSERFSVEVIRESADEGFIKMERKHPSKYFYAE